MWWYSSPFFPFLFVNNLWTNPNTLTVYLISRHFHKLIPVFEAFATSLLWICVIWSSWWGTSHRVDTRNLKLIQQSFCLEAEQFPSHSYKAKPGWKVINIWGGKKVQAVWNSESNTPHLTSLSYFFLLELFFLPSFLSRSIKAINPCLYCWGTGLCIWHTHSSALWNVQSSLPCLSAAPGQKY